MPNPHMLWPLLVTPAGRYAIGHLSKPGGIGHGFILRNFFADDGATATADLSPLASSEKLPRGTRMIGLARHHRTVPRSYDLVLCEAS